MCLRHFFGMTITMKLKFVHIFFKKNENNGPVVKNLITAATWSKMWVQIPRQAWILSSSFCAVLFL
jgi:hypothetical protein